MQYLLRKQVILFTLSIIIGLNSFGQFNAPNREEHLYDQFWLGITFGAANQHFDYILQKATIPNTGTTKYLTNIGNDNNLYYTMGLSATMRIFKKLQLRTTPSVILGKNNINGISFAPTDSLQYTLNSNSSILYIPLQLKYESDRYSFFRQRDFITHYIIAGAGMYYDFSNSNTSLYPNDISTGSSNASVIKKTDYAWEIGAGLSFYLKYATISPELKFSYSFKNVVDPNSSNTILNNSNSIIKSMNNNYVFFTILIEN